MLDTTGRLRCWQSAATRTLFPRRKCALQDLLGVVAEMSWNDSDNCLNLTATCPLPANLPLTTALIAVGADPDHLLMTHGLPALSWAQSSVSRKRQCDTHTNVSPFTDFMDTPGKDSHFGLKSKDDGLCAPDVERHQGL